MYSYKNLENDSKTDKIATKDQKMDRGWKQEHSIKITQNLLLPRKTKQTDQKAVKDILQENFPEIKD